MHTTYTDEKTAFKLKQEFECNCPLTKNEIESLKQEVSDIICSVDPAASLPSLTPYLNDCWNIGFWCDSELYLIPFEVDMLAKHDLFLNIIASKSEQLLH